MGVLSYRLRRVFRLATLRLWLFSHLLSSTSAATVEIIRVNSIDFSGQSIAPDDVLSYQIDPSPSGYAASELVFRTLGGFLLKIGPLPATAADGAFATGSFTIPGVQSGHYLMSLSDNQSGQMTGDTPELQVIVGGGADINPDSSPQPVQSQPTPAHTSSPISPAQTVTSSSGRSSVPNPTVTDNTIHESSASNPNTSTTSSGGDLIPDNNSTTPLFGDTSSVTRNTTPLTQLPAISPMPTKSQETSNIASSTSVSAQVQPPGTEKTTKISGKVLAAIIGGAVAFMIFLCLVLFCLCSKRTRQSYFPSRTLFHRRLPKFLTLAHPYHVAPSTTSESNVSSSKSKSKDFAPSPHQAPRAALIDIIALLHDQLRQIQETNNTVSMSTNSTSAEGSYISDGPPPQYHDAVSNVS
ncbi:hypothetical protein BDN70DRAFT_962756 [Pholiota conissans]|uniref:Uncharacterized protein n=1 Tax=Pholiota conissans TaxID=109636 RepID=A0A9P5YRA7_9AGAR|nr:hypothetical protein BDN70DRAFT_962756 [Pholiota conissans]